MQWHACDYYIESHIVIVFNILRSQQYNYNIILLKDYIVIYGYFIIIVRRKLDNKYEPGGIEFDIIRNIHCEDHGGITHTPSI